MVLECCDVYRTSIYALKDYQHRLCDLLAGETPVHYL